MDPISTGRTERRRGGCDVALMFRLWVVLAGRVRAALMIGASNTRTVTHSYGVTVYDCEGWRMEKLRPMAMSMVMVG